MNEPKPQRSTRRQVAALAGFIAVCLAAGALGSMVTAPQIPEWYSSLNKPPWNPPSWVFAPVWTVLYVMMGVAGWLVWTKTSSPFGQAFRWFWIQLALNSAWSLIFFGLERPGLALAEILLLWLGIALTLAAFRRHSSVATLLLVPYLGWTIFAAYLNFTIWRLN
jgi:tryptophan-rich sensory protein